VDSHGWPNPKIIGRTIGLDTIAHGVLTAMRLPAEFFKAADTRRPTREWSRREIKGARLIRKR
jgi:hypothetical protein